ncbi:hypothetical protein SAMN04488101_11937 [Pedobacter nyackensis]|uniref:Uncharacterized protein n=1 Tax=Pedobacter nyackensis TaxID=475255 RepID=A0A1W2F2H7_9SPHI|nr:hypothetical protein SAMN04488101_11937 [Pedobacter nyackensis]
MNLTQVKIVFGYKSMVYFSNVYVTDIVFFVKTLQYALKKSGNAPLYR